MLNHNNNRLVNLNHHAACLQCNKHRSRSKTLCNVHTAQVQIVPAATKSLAATPAAPLRARSRSSFWLPRISLDRSLETSGLHTPGLGTRNNPLSPHLQIQFLTIFGQCGSNPPRMRTQFLTNADPIPRQCGPYPSPMRIQFLAGADHIPRQCGPNSSPVRTQFLAGADPIPRPC